MEEFKATILTFPTLSVKLPGLHINDSGTKNHSELLQRDFLNQHPIRAITGLQDALDEKLPRTELKKAIDSALFQAKESGDFKGEKGDKGDRGLQGEQGIPGPQGKQGERGLQGIQGDRGEQGPQGKTGPAGAQGEKGAKGDKGDKGEPGEKGADGTPGKDGAPGKSAFEYAKENGYTGTESQFGEELASSNERFEAIEEELDRLGENSGGTGENGKDGFSPIVEVTPISGGHKVSITDATGTDTFNVMNGIDGIDGKDGSNGTDGFSPAVSVNNIIGGYRVSITDKNGTETFNVMDGADGSPGKDGTDGTNGKDGAPGKDGADGFSPTVEVTEITGGHRVSVTDKNGTKTFNVMDGTDGEDGEDAVVPEIKTVISVNLSQYESNGKIVETYSDNSTVTYSFQFDANRNPTKITDSNGNETILIW